MRDNELCTGYQSKINSQEVIPDPTLLSVITDISIEINRGYSINSDLLLINDKLSGSIPIKGELAPGLDDKTVNTHLAKLIELRNRLINLNNLNNNELIRLDHFVG